MEQVKDIQKDKLDDLIYSYQGLLNVLDTDKFNVNLIYKLRDINLLINQTVDKIDMLKIRLKEGLIELTNEEKNEIIYEEKADKIIKKCIPFALLQTIMTDL